MQIDITEEECATLILALALLSIETIKEFISPETPPNRVIDILKEDGIPHRILKQLRPETRIETILKLVKTLDWPHVNQFFIDPGPADAQEIKRRSPHG